MTIFFTDIRKASLLAFIGTVVALPLPLWKSARAIIDIASRNPEISRWMLPALAIGFLFAAVLPVFYFALHRNEGRLQRTDDLRFLSLVAAIVFSALMAVSLWVWLGSLGPYWSHFRELDWRTGASIASTLAQDPWFTQFLSDLLAELGQFCYLPLLIALSRNTSNDSADLPLSRRFRIVTRIAVIAYGIWVAFELVRLIMTPYFYAQMQNAASLPAKAHFPALWPAMLRKSRDVLSLICLFTAPYVVYKSQSRPERVSQDPPILPDQCEPDEECS